MTEEQYRQLEIDDIVYYEKDGVRRLRRMRSQLSDSSIELESSHSLSTSELLDDDIGCEGLYLNDIQYWQANKFLEIDEMADWVRIALLECKVARLEEFIYSRLR